MRVKQLFLLWVLVSGATACASELATQDRETGSKESASTNEQMCTEPRPEICTMIYDPVCGRDQFGSEKTYASDCSACGNQAVVSYRKGACGKNMVQE